jgi:TonB family protein
VKSPQILSKVKPKYTEDARRDKIQGVVVLSAVFRKDGTISEIKVVRGLGYGLDEEAVKAAALIKFVPGQKDGQSVNVRARLEFTFSLL